MRVAQGVVGHHPFDAGDAVGGEVVDGAGEERGAGRALLVGEDLGVGEPGVVIDDGVHVVVADLGVLAFRLVEPHLAAVGPPAAAVGDPADLLDVHVDQLARAAHVRSDGGGLRGADQLTGERVAASHSRGMSWRRRIRLHGAAGTPSSGPSQS